MTDQTVPLTWPNNQSTIEQADPDGDYQTLAWLDGDYNFILGPLSKPTIPTYVKNPINFWRQYQMEDFNGVGLPSCFTSSITGGGSISSVAPGKLCLRTGAAAAGDGVTIWMPNLFTCMPYDARLYFYLECPTAGYFDLQFGFKSLTTYERAMFRRYDVATGSPWQAFTQDAAGNPVGTYFAEGGDNYRRTGIIWLQGNQVAYYAADEADGNMKASQPNPFAVHTTHLPTQTSQLVPFVSFHSAGQAADRTVLIDTIAFSGNK